MGSPSRSMSSMVVISFSPRAVAPVTSNSHPAPHFEHSVMRSTSAPCLNCSPALPKSGCHLRNHFRAATAVVIVPDTSTPGHPQRVSQKSIRLRSGR